MPKHYIKGIGEVEYNETVDTEALCIDTTKKLTEQIFELKKQLDRFIKEKRARYNKFNGYRGTRFKCPTCNKSIENCIDFVGEYHCKHCGQSIVYPKFRVVNNVGELYFDEDK